MNSKTSTIAIRQLQDKIEKKKRKMEFALFRFLTTGLIVIMIIVILKKKRLAFFLLFIL